MNIENQIKKEFRDMENWVEQFSNYIYAFAWTIGRWLSFSFHFIAGAIMIFAIFFVFGEKTLELNEITQQEAYGLFKTMVIAGVLISLAVALIFSLPHKLRNVFSEKAEYRVNRYNQLKKEFENDKALIEVILVKNKLIHSKTAYKPKERLKGYFLHSCLIRERISDK